MSMIQFFGALISKFDSISELAMLFSITLDSIDLTECRDHVKMARENTVKAT